MVAGLNIKVSIWQMNNADDDDVGGAVITGTLAYQDVLARLTARRPSQVSLEAGLETDKFFDMVLIGRGVSVDERDEIQVTSPNFHPFFNDRFRIMGIQKSGQRRDYGHTQMTLSRIVRSRSQQ
jgi:hypothetical protein